MAEDNIVHVEFAPEFRFGQAYGRGNMVCHRHMPFECVSDLVWERYPTSTEGRKHWRLMLAEAGLTEDQVSMADIYEGLPTRLEDIEERLNSLEKGIAR